MKVRQMYDELTPLPVVPSVVRTVPPEGGIGDVAGRTAFTALPLLRPRPPMQPSPSRAGELRMEDDFGRSRDVDAVFPFDEGADTPMAFDGLTHAFPIDVGAYATTALDGPQ